MDIAIMFYSQTDLSFNITEVVIGGWSNTKSVYRNGVTGDQRHYLDVDTTNIAHCTEFRTFWISWGLVSCQRVPFLYGKTNRNTAARYFQSRIKKRDC